MQDLISRPAAIEALDGEIEITGRTNAEAVKGYVRLVKDRLEQLPSAEPERKRGEWTDDNACQFCGFHPWYERDIHTLSFCPNCGARMEV